VVLWWASSLQGYRQHTFRQGIAEHTQIDDSRNTTVSDWAIRRLMKV